MSYINGEAVKKERIEDFSDEAERSLSGPAPQFVETLPNGVSYRVLDTTPMGAADNTEEYVVPENHYFMMGDNRDNSQDFALPVGGGLCCPSRISWPRRHHLLLGVARCFADRGVAVAFVIRWSRFLPDLTPLLRLSPERAAEISKRIGHDFADRSLLALWR